jgi:hypothetical protein
VIEGYGRIVLGTKGFRAQKARIVALALPEGPSAPDNARAHAVPADGPLAPGDGARIRERYPDVAVFPREEAMLAAFPPTEDGPTL